MSDQEMRKDIDESQFASEAKTEDNLNPGNSVPANEFTATPFTATFETQEISGFTQGDTPNQNPVSSQGVADYPGVANLESEFVDASAQLENSNPNEFSQASVPATPQMQTLAEERAALKAARAEALSASPVATYSQPIYQEPQYSQPQMQSPAPQEVATAVEVVEEARQSIDKNIGKKPNDKFLPSLGLFILRWVTAFILGVKGVDIVTHVSEASEFITRLQLPKAELLAWGIGVSLLVIAVCLVFGLLTRIAGLLLAVLAGLVLAFYYWGPWSIFVEGQPGFLGEYELLLGVVGLVFFTIGAGGWSLDRSFRVGRARDKAERALAEG